jgi:hypothetical protein
MLKGSKPADPEIKWIVDPAKVHSVLNVRVTPNGKIVGHLGPGTKVEVVEEKGDWARIGTDRWVFKSYLKKT